MNNMLISLIEWMKANAELAGWIQAIGVVVALAFGIAQLRQATEALKASALNNEIALRTSASDLLVGINEAALNNPDAAGEFAGHKRLHLMRLHYFYRAFDLRQAGLIDDDGFAAETAYLSWSASQPDFIEVWKVFRTQYRSGFREWVDQTIERANVEVATASN